jgi:hypothetical protein
MVVTIRSHVPSEGRHLFRVTAFQRANRWSVSHFMTIERLSAAPTWGSGR